MSAYKANKGTITRFLAKRLGAHQMCGAHRSSMVRGWVSVTPGVEVCQHWSTREVTVEWHPGTMGQHSEASEKLMREQVHPLLVERFGAARVTTLEAWQRVVFVIHPATGGES